jgi:phosphatidate phosphatase PAH1
MKSDIENEVLDRIIRIESRVVQLGDHVGANLRTKQRIAFRTDDKGDLVADVDSYDVSLSRILAELRQRHPGFDMGELPVFIHGKQVMRVML